MIKFPKKPNCYDFYGVPQYYSRCHNYRLSHYRSGPVENGKAKIDEWRLHFCSKKKGLSWIHVHPIGSNYVSKKDAIHVAREHDLFLRAEKAVAKKMKGKK